MLDQFGRKIDYMRISLTDRCNLRCRYCMPEGAKCMPAGELLCDGEILRIVRAAVALGIENFKITGGEPLTRAGCAALIKEIKAIGGVREVTLTTNALLLAGMLDELIAAGVDGINISLDTLDPRRYSRLTGSSEQGLRYALDALELCCAKGIKTKINCVLLDDTLSEAVCLSALAEKYPVDVRFIELMPIGHGATLKRAEPDDVLALLQAHWRDLRPTAEKRGNGPAHYYESPSLLGKIGFIDAVSHKFCAQCNRVRLTCTGEVKPCLCYGETTDLKALMRAGCTDDMLYDALKAAVYKKPRAHCFDMRELITEKHIMSQIGG